MKHVFIAIAAAVAIASPVNAQVVPDGRGGYVPSTNSRYDPITGNFLPPAQGVPRGFGEFFGDLLMIPGIVFGGVLAPFAYPYPYPDPYAPSVPLKYYLTPSPYAEEQAAPEPYEPEPAAPRRRLRAANPIDRERTDPTPIPTPSCAEDPAFCEDEPAVK